MGPRLSFACCLAAVAWLLACTPDIGDSCRLHSDCSVTGDRICEPTFPGGYCTVFNCEPGKCPEEAVCVAYYSTPTADLACSDPTERRFQRTFCMKNCSGNSDCRTNYECVDLGRPDNAFAAVVVEQGSYNARVCTRPLPPVTPVENAAVCSPPPNVSFPEPPTDSGSTAPDSPRTDGAAVDGAPLPLKDASPSDARSTP